MPRIRVVTPGRLLVGRCLGAVLAGLLLVLAAACSSSDVPDEEAPESPFDAVGDEPNRGGTIDLAATDPEVALERLQVAEGYHIELFASEQDFPIGNPVSLTFDAQGRMWVVTMPAYPHRLPDVPPNDKLIILEDTDRDGRADAHTVFADSLYIPTGFELGDGGVYIAQEPNLMFLEDTDGDDVADERTLLLHGFGTEDSHHAISAFTWGPGGDLFFQEGTFLHSQVETPYGTVRLVDSGVFRYEPRTEKLEVYVSYNFANPWGHVFDRWGQSFIADASNGNNYFGSPMTGHVEYPYKHPQMRVFTSKVRPTSGAEFVRSRHFPEEAQGNFLVNNVIGFQGIKQHRVYEEGSGFTSEEVEPLLYSVDRNFRPVDLQFGPDGALYIVDWFNPLVGHMQYSLRDENRDQTHGRIWRITYEGNPLLEPVDLTTLSVPALMDELKVYEDRTRYRVRRELRERDPEDVQAAVAAWVDGLDESDPEVEHHRLEALWIYQHLDVVNEALLERVLASPEPQARAAAVRVLRVWRDRLPDPVAVLSETVRDEHPRVRLEALLALSFYRTPDAAEIALTALEQPMDYYLDYTLQETITTLEPYWKPLVAEGRPFSGDNLDGIRYVLERIDTDTLLRMARNVPVHEALLARPGVPDSYRTEALDALAAQDGIPRAAVYTATLSRLDESGRSESLGDLARLMGDESRASLRAQRPAFEVLARDAETPDVRAVAYAALIHTDGTDDAAWAMAEESVEGLNDFVAAADHIWDPETRSVLYDRMALLASDLPPATPGEGSTEAVTARYVRIDLPGQQRLLTLAEIEVLGPDGTNRAPSGEAVQSSFIPGGDAGGMPENGIDGNTSGSSSARSFILTQREPDPWWEVDLGQDAPVRAVVVWNRTDWMQEEAEGYALTLLDADRQTVYRRTGNRAPSPSDTLDLTAATNTDALHQAAIQALPGFEGHDAETFGVLADLVREGRYVGASVRALRRLDDSAWPGDDLGALGDAVAAAAGRVPVIEREGETFETLLAFGRDVAARLVGAEQQALLGALASTEPTVVRIKTVEAQMAYDVTDFTVEAERPVLVILENEDVMPHNLVVSVPGSMEAVGEMGDAMASDPEAFEKNFIPETDQVLWATPLIDAGDNTRLGFLAPEDPGDYPYLCTFPAHWRTMNGVMTVTPAGEAL